MSFFKFPLLQQKSQDAKNKSKGKAKGSSKKVNAADKGFAKKLDRELPYVITLITIMAASGVTPFGSFTRLAKYKLLPYILKESRNILGQVHILGEDPLTAMEKRANVSASKQYRDLLLGYISTVRNGGDIASYLQSKMKSIFEYEVAMARQSVAKVGGLVDAYMIMQVIGLSLYVVVIAMSSMSGLSDLVPSAMSSPLFSYMIVFVMLPSISMAIMFALDRAVTSYLVGARGILMRGIYYSLAAIVAFVVLTVAGVIQMVINPIYAFPLFIIAATAQPAFKASKIEKNMKAMESELAGYLRDVAEARKAGLSPEKCIIYASERLRNPTFTEVAKAFANELEWGVPLKKIFANLTQNMKSWLALIHFKILMEAIESGGGYTTSLEILAQSSESTEVTEKEKKAMMSPYIMVAFMVTALTAVTTLMVAQTFLDISSSVLPGSSPAPQASPTNSGGLSQIQLFAIGIAAQSWVTGFLMGKISSGSFATGFKYGIILIAITLLVTVATQEFHISPSILMKSSAPS